MFHSADDRQNSPMRAWSKRFLEIQIVVFQFFRQSIQLASLQQSARNFLIELQ